MTAANYDRSFALVLKSEGGYSNHPSDPGGPTNLGITLATLRAFRGRSVTVDDVKSLTKEEAGQIYRRNYWEIVRADSLPAGVDYAVFDFGVNSGPRTAAKFLQRCLRVTDDGEIGPLTLAAARQISPGDLVNALCDRRLDYLRALGTWSTFGKGWASRIAMVRKAALEMAAQPATHDQPPPTGLPLGDPPRPPPAGDGLGEPDQTEQPASTAGFFMAALVMGCLVVLAIAKLFHLI